jgi:hypothetical protein
MSNYSDVARVHTDLAGKVWLRAEGDVRCVGGVADFLACPEFSYSKEIWAVGDRCNADLLTKAFIQRKPAHVIKIGTPSVCPTVAQREDPHIVLSMIDDLHGCASSIGGFHQMTNSDYTVYRMVNHLSLSPRLRDSECRHLVKYHPAWAALSFIPSLDIDNACVMLARIIDPRWFVSPGRPNRLQRLYTFLGLNENCFATSTGYNSIHANIVQDAWSSIAGTKPRPELDEPSNFLWRLVDKHQYSPKGYYLAARKFVQFVRAVWLDTLVVSKSFDGWFVPEYFFSNDAEIRAYRKHREKFKTPVEKIV